MFCFKACHIIIDHRLSSPYTEATNFPTTSIKLNYQTTPNLLYSTAFSKSSTRNFDGASSLNVSTPPHPPTTIYRPIAENPTFFTSSASTFFPSSVSYNVNPSQHVNFSSPSPLNILKRPRLNEPVVESGAHVNIPCVEFPETSLSVGIRQELFYKSTLSQLYNELINKEEIIRQQALTINDLLKKLPVQNNNFFPQF